MYIYIYTKTPNSDQNNLIYIYICRYLYIAIYIGKQYGLNICRLVDTYHIHSYEQTNRSLKIVDDKRIDLKSYDLLERIKSLIQKLFN